VTVTVIILWCHQLMNPSLVQVRSLSEDLSRSVCLRYCPSNTCRDHTSEHQIRLTDTACTRNTKSNLSLFLRCFVCEMYDKDISALFAFYKEIRRWNGSSQQLCHLEVCHLRCVCENWKGYVVKHNCVN